MSKLEQLIQQYCPDGVEYRALGEVCEMKRGTSATKDTLKEGRFPVISGGRQPAFYCDEANRTGEIITVAGSGAGAGYVQYWNEPIFVCDAFSIEGTQLTNTKFVYYCLTNMQEKIYTTKKGGGVPHVHISSIERFEIPVPPLPVQEEIVRILDKFSLLSAELEAELEGRRKQYDFYRNQLLSFDSSSVPVQWKKLGEVCKSVKSGKCGSRSAVGEYPVYGSTGIIAYTDVFQYDTNSILVARVGANAGFVHIAQGKYDVTDNTLIIQLNESECVFKYVYYYLSNLNINQFAKGGGQPLITGAIVKGLLIPIPPLSEQERIVDILDRFDILTNDLTTGLPAEIAARKRQYEYYRDKLLTFKRRDA